MSNVLFIFPTVAEECQSFEPGDHPSGQVECIVVTIGFGPIAIVFDPSPKSLSTHLPTYCQRQPVVGGFGTVGFIVDCTLVDHSLRFVKSFDVVGYHK